jgi:hypothetical protein
VFDTLRVDEVDIVSETWHFNNPAAPEYFRLLIQKSLNVAIRTDDSTHTLAAFVMFDYEGYYTHLYTFPRYRRKGLTLISCITVYRHQTGLAAAAELYLAQKVIAQEKICPAKLVLRNNNVGLALCDKMNTHWTRHTTEWNWCYISCKSNNSA